MIVMGIVVVFQCKDLANVNSNWEKFVIAFGINSDPSKGISHTSDVRATSTPSLLRVAVQYLANILVASSDDCGNDDGIGEVAVVSKTS